MRTTRALYAFLMTRQPVTSARTANELPFPLERAPAARRLEDAVLRRGRLSDRSPRQNAEWNRGAYLVEGLGHCGACHTPRNVLGAEKSGPHLAGGEAEGWTASRSMPARPHRCPWTRTACSPICARAGMPDHGVAADRWREVIGNLGRLPDADIRAIATYIASMHGRTVAGALARRTGRSSAKPSRPMRARPLQRRHRPARRPGVAPRSMRRPAPACHDGSRPLPFRRASNLQLVEHA